MCSTTSLKILRSLSTKCKTSWSSIVPKTKFDKINLKNEPILEYKKDSKELKALEKSLEKFCNCVQEIPIIIGGKEFKTADQRFQVMPHRHKDTVAKFYYADKNLIEKAIRATKKSKKEWDNTSFQRRIEIWEKAASLMAEKYRGDLVAATMLGQAKTIYQAEIDAGVELIDFMRLNAAFLKELLNYEPINPDLKHHKNHMTWRSLHGFVAAISPFNFTAIGGNLAFTPALMGNCVLWKPADAAMLSSWLIYKIMLEAGLPGNVVNFVPAHGPLFGDTITYSENLGGINFTGSVPTFRSLVKLVGKHMQFYETFPRLSGECGGKNYHFVHPSADVQTVLNSTIRSAFEYSGQKCSSCSRLYVPESLWESKLKNPLCELTCELIIGDVCNYKSFTSAVIDEKSFLRINQYLDYIKSNTTCDIIVGGHCSNLHGYFVEPTLFLVTDPMDYILKEEIFGPVLAIFVYKDQDLDKTIELACKVSKYALTGAVFATDEKFLKESLEKFKNSAGNFYINDKSTGAVVAQQPFGGGRLSGTNDKPGSHFYLLRWASAQTIKEMFVPTTDIYYPYMGISKT